jgi:hypothetical protein
MVGLMRLAMNKFADISFSKKLLCVANGETHVR